MADVSLVALKPKLRKWGIKNSGTKDEVATRSAQTKRFFDTGKGGDAEMYRHFHLRGLQRVARNLGIRLYHNKQQQWRAITGKSVPDDAIDRRPSRQKMSRLSQNVARSVSKVRPASPRSWAATVPGTWYNNGDRFWTVEQDGDTVITRYGTLSQKRLRTSRRSYLDASTAKQAAQARALDKVAQGFRQANGRQKRSSRPQPEKDPKEEAAPEEEAPEEEASQQEEEADPEAPEEEATAEDLPGQVFWLGDRYWAVERQGRDLVVRKGVRGTGRPRKVRFAFRHRQDAMDELQQLVDERAALGYELQ